MGSRESKYIIIHNICNCVEISLVQKVYQNAGGDTSLITSLYRSNPELRQLFLKLSDTQNKRVEAIRIQKGQIRSYLGLKYQKSIVEKIMQAFDFPSFINFEDYCLAIEKFLRKEYIDKMQLAFNCFDYNGDGKLCINDAFQCMKHLGKHDYLLQNDIIKINQLFSRKFHEDEIQAARNKA